MFSYKKIFAVCLLAITLLATPLTAFAENPVKEQLHSKSVPPDPGIMIVDLVAVRPLGIVATLAGTAFFIVSTPFSALGGNMDEAWESLVESPATFTFKRPLGEFDD